MDSLALSSPVTLSHTSMRAVSMLESANVGRA
jgi:hypothetical protein